MRTITFSNYKDGIMSVMDDFNSVCFGEYSTRIYLIDTEETSDKRHLVGRIFSHRTDHIAKIYLDTKRDIKSIKEVKIWDGHKNIWVKEIVCDFEYPFGSMNRVGATYNVAEKSLLEEELFGSMDTIKTVYSVSISKYG